MTTAAQKRWRSRPIFCEPCNITTTQQHLKRHQQSATHKRLEALDLLPSDVAFTEFLHNIRTAMFTNIEAVLYQKAVDKWQL